MKRKILVLFLIVFVILIFYNLYVNSNVYTTNINIKSERIPKEFDGFKIVQISDLHNEEFGEGNVKILDKVKEEKPDIIAITGDIIDSNTEDITIAVNLAKNLNDIAPTYYITGNHEAGHTLLGKLLLELENAGVTILRNSVKEIKRGESIIEIIGVDDPSFSEYDFLLGDFIDLNDYSKGSKFKLLLSHRPELFDLYVENNMDLVLAGHAHGGQFRLPFVGGLIAPNQGFFPKYDAGVYTKNNTSMIVSRGIGNSIIPFRFNNPPEIISIELTIK